MDTNTMCIIILILACVSILVYLLYRIKKDGLIPVVVKMIVAAEDQFEKGANQEKIDYVIDSLLEFLPKILRCFITRENVKSFVQKVFNGVKEALDYKAVDKQENNVIYNK